MDDYFDRIENKTKKLKKLAEKAREKGYDPEKRVDIPLAKEVSEKVEKLVASKAQQLSDSGMAKRIRELEDEYEAGDWRVGLIISEEVANEKFCDFENEKEALEMGLRTGLAYITRGIVSAPLEGFVRVEERKRQDGDDYLAIFYAGPIRGAGGTAASVSVLIADYLRKKMGYEPYDPTEDELQRYVYEINDYDDISNLQYCPSSREIRFLVDNIPVQVTGTPSSRKDVSGKKDLDRIETNRIRGGMCLVLGEGISQKASKMWRRLEGWGEEFDLGNWKFLKKFMELQKEVQSKGEENEEEKENEKKIKPKYKYLEDIVAGRPILSHPLEKGGLRLRYGRTRLTGHDSLAFHPATLEVLDGFIALGTQLKVERPGKACTVTVCDSIEGPIVKLNDGSVTKLETREKAKELNGDVEKVLFLGDILVNYGAFLEHNRPLAPAGYCPEWWIKEVKGDLDGILPERAEEIMKNPEEVSLEEAIKIAESGLPMHPEYIFFWGDIDKEELKELVDYLKEGEISDNIMLKKDERKKILEKLGVLHRVEDEKIVIDEEDSKALLENLGFDKKIEEGIEEGEDVLEIINRASGYKIREKAPAYIGARMGRPEKAKLRKLTGKPQMLFPVGEEGGRMRNLIAAMEEGYVEAEFPAFSCPKCNSKTIFKKCEVCGSETREWRVCRRCGKYTREEEHCGIPTSPYESKKVNINHYVEKALENLDMDKNALPELVKGVRGTSNKKRIGERIEKGILRALNKTYVNKDGTIRFDMTEMCCTQFKPREISTSIEKLKELGYKEDIHGNELENDNQLLALKPQDLILPRVDFEDANAAEALFKVTNFVDDLLEKFYDIDSYYDAEDPSDVVGSLVIGLAPHTSCGTVGRIIGFTNVQGLIAHPYFHAALRRDADGDEAAVMLLVDAFLNFSTSYLPAKRGGSMDAPLVLTVTLDLDEVDDEVYDVDTVYDFPLELYEKSLEMASPKEVDIEIVEDRLDKDTEFDALGFTHSVSDMQAGPTVSKYKTLATMAKKVNGQMEIGERIRAVDTGDLAKKVIEKHFLRDIMGNLRKFSVQEFRCVDCNTKYRRVPLRGKCTECGGDLVFTIAEGTVKKYLEPALKLANEYEVPTYLTQNLDIIKRKIESLFGSKIELQTDLNKYMGS